MQAVLSFAPPSALFPPTRSLPISRKHNTLSQPIRCSEPIKASVTVADDGSVVDYSSTVSVFPAEACEITGGDACNAEMYPEVKLKAEARSKVAKNTSEMVDREYLEYDSPKTVFREEACDDLGGEFCQADFMKD